MKLHIISNWHRYLGLSISLFVVLLAITGILLLHTDDLRLQDRFMNSPGILDWYGITPDSEPRAYAVGQGWIVQLDEQVYFDGEVLTATSETLKGALVLGDYIVVAFDNSLYLLTSDGVLIERMSQAQGVPAGIYAIAPMTGGGIVVKTARGKFVADAELAQWSQVNLDSVPWVLTEEAPRSEIETVMSLYRGDGLTMERVILDLHSGRILGRYGPWLIDVIAVLFLVLSLTGWWSWIKRRALQRELEQE